MRDRRCFVQFIHPGGEHVPDTPTAKRWNTADHRRKFLRASGEYVEGGEVRHGEIAFWGEWEPESDVIRRYDSADGQPHYLYDPYFVRHEDAEWRQNTDPFVFGDHFHYTGCLQHTRRGPTQLRNLALGSLILFGSCWRRAQFVVDTVFVVADHVDHRNGREEELLAAVSDTYRTVTVEPWYRGTLPPGQSHRLYFGATREEPVGGMFSFFPCRRLGEGGEAFSRPAIRLPGYITSHLTQGKKITRDLSVGEVAELWREVVAQVVAQGCVLGVRANLPRERPAARAGA